MVQVGKVKTVNRSDINYFVEWDKSIQEFITSFEDEFDDKIYSKEDNKELEIESKDKRYPQILLPAEKHQESEDQIYEIWDILDTNNRLSCDILECSRCSKMLENITVTASYKPFDTISLSNGWEGKYDYRLVTYERDKNIFIITSEEGFVCPECTKELELLEQKLEEEYSRIESKVHYSLNTEPSGPDWLGNCETEDEFWEHTD